MDGITQPNKKTILKFFFCCHMVSFLLEKKRKKIKNVEKTSNIYARFWLPIIKRLNLMKSG